MSQFSDIVKRQGKKLEAEKWAKTVKTVHCHRLKSMGYDTRPQDTDAHSVTDIEYNDGLVERRLHDGEIVYFGKRLSGNDLVDEFTRNTK